MSEPWTPTTVLRDKLTLEDAEYVARKLTPYIRQIVRDEVSPLALDVRRLKRKSRLWAWLRAAGIGLAAWLIKQKIE